MRKKLIENVLHTTSLKIEHFREIYFSLVHWLLYLLMSFSFSAEEVHSNECNSSMSHKTINKKKM